MPLSARTGVGGDNSLMQRGERDYDDDPSRPPAWVSRLRVLLSAPLPDPGVEFDRHRAEEWAVLEFARLREELRREELAKRRSFIQGQVCARITDGHSRAVAARLAGVTPETVAGWCRKDPVFAAAVGDAESAAGPGQREHWRLKMTAGVQEALVRLLRSGASRKDAAAAAGVSRQTLYTWVKQRPDFRQAVLAAEASARLDRPGRSRRDADKATD